MQFKSAFQKDSSNQQRSIIWDELTLNFNSILVKKKQKDDIKTARQLQDKYGAIGVLLFYLRENLLL